jgi:hypothetical protein
MSLGTAWSHTFINILIALSFNPHPLLAQSATGCATKQHAVDAARARVKQDQKSIQALNLGITSEDIQEWVDDADKERREVLRDTLLNSVGLTADAAIASTNLAKDALQPMSIAGVPLAHGIGSLGTGQASQIIGRLQRLGGDSQQVQALTDSIRDLSSFQNKTETLEFAAKVNDTATQFKQIFGTGTGVSDISNADDWLTTTAVALQLLAPLAGKADIGVDVGEALFSATQHLADAYLLSSILNNTLNPEGPPQPLNDSRYEVQGSQGTVNPPQYPPAGKDITERRLTALKSLSRQLDQDVKTLDHAKAQMGNCHDCPDQSAMAGGLAGTWSVTWHFDNRPDLGNTTETWEFTKTGRCVLTLQMQGIGGNCPPPVEITATAPNTYSGKWAQDDGCVGGLMDIQVHDSSLSFKRTGIYDNAPQSGAILGTGRRLPH